MKESYRQARDGFYFYLSYLKPSSIKAGIAKLRTLNNIELLVLLLSSVFWIVYGFGYGIIKVVVGFMRVLLCLMRGEPIFAGKKDDKRKPTIGEI